MKNNTASSSSEPTRLYSGIQPTGEIHIGNYLGAISNWVKLIPKYDCIYCIVDYHAITIDYDRTTMLDATLDTAMLGMACGLDPERCTMFIQSHVMETLELAWIFNTVTSLGVLERMTQFKDKSSQHTQNINAGLFTYPVLQAADILGVKADGVPVGEDQAQHLELTREIARRFNHLYGETFPVPKTLLSHTPRIMGLDGQNKMSKSRDNYISMKDHGDVIRKKLSTAYTDPNRLRRSDPGDPDICNIYTLHKSFSSRDEVAMIDTECRNAGIGCVDCKKILAKNMETEMAPIQEKYDDLAKRPDDVKDALAKGAQRVKALSQPTMTEVRKNLGLR
ncbi:MAG TPA: tryptophan--tRNA ligase [Candidatus Latescibacteria bacterium]|jgi:tryptophanyl-tRNA synthetase|nr:tryptophan--tRNA ligase [Candidatus Latescibacterota bacterium]